MKKQAKKTPNSQKVMLLFSLSQVMDILHYISNPSNTLADARRLGELRGTIMKQLRGEK